MNNSSPTQAASASSLKAGKITRKQLADYCGLCVRTIDELTRTGVLGHFRIGKAVRYDLAEVEATLRERFHVAARAGAGCSSAASSSSSLSGKTGSEENPEVPDGGLRTSRPTSSRPTLGRPTSRAAATAQPTTAA